MIARHIPIWILFFGVCFPTANAQGPAPAESSNFLDYLNRQLSNQRKTVVNNGASFDAKIELNALCPVYSRNTSLQYVADRILREYGALFVGDNSSLAGMDLYPHGTGFKLTAQCIFPDEESVRRYQSKVSSRQEHLSGTRLELAAHAMEALLRARSQAAALGLAITPRGGSQAGKRSYHDTKRLWDSRFLPGLDYWVARRVISRQEASNLKAMDSIDQVARVLELEQSRKAFFSKDRTKSILYSVAAPGASQHIFMLAVDINEFANREVRQILAENGWYQTVKSDLPHFTYLGIKDKAQLRIRGLKMESVQGQEFWTPRIE